MSDAAVIATRPTRFDWAGIVGAIMPFVVALIVGAILLAATGRDPLEVYGLMLDEGFGGPDELAATLSAATPVLFCAVATAISFRAGVFNMGVEGAFYLGGLAGAVAGFSFPGLPGPLHIVVELAIGAAIGGLWLTLPGWLKAQLDVDEVVSTLMLNFVAINFTAYLVNHVFLAPGAGNSQTPLIVEAGWLPRLMPPATLNLGFIIALVLLVAYDLWGRFTPLGFEARVTGLNARFSRAVGIDVSALIIKTAAISGLIGGLAGASHAAGLVHRFVAGFSPGYGFTGLAVVLLGRNNAVGMLIGAIIFGALSSAGTTVQLFSDIPIQIVDVLQGTVTVFAVVRFGGLLRRRWGHR
ncbi:MAG TPA: ABC transporter permease [Magnetospirillaceae bacterium]|jgi:simple sugar transport system permease protein